MHPKPTKATWIISSEEDKKPTAITAPNPPLEIIKQLASKKPLRRPQPPKQDEAE